MALEFLDDRLTRILLGRGRRRKTLHDKIEVSTYISGVHLLTDCVTGDWAYRAANRIMGETGVKNSTNYAKVHYVP